MSSQKLQLSMFTTPVTISAKTQLDIPVEQEDAQTSYDADLFNDEDMEGPSSQLETHCDKLNTLQLFVKAVRRCLHQARLMSGSSSI